MILLQGGRDRKIPWAHWPDNSVGLVIPQNEEEDYLAFGLQTDLHTYEHLDAYHLHKVYIHAYKKLRKFFQGNLSFLCVSILQQCDLKSCFTIPLTLVTWRCGWTEGLQSFGANNEHTRPAKSEARIWLYVVGFIQQPSLLNKWSYFSRKKTPIIN